MLSHPADLDGPMVFVGDLDSPALTAEDDHHLRRVLRLRDGAPLTVADGRGRWRAARLGDRIEPVGPVVVTPSPQPALAVGFALVKGDTPELATQKLTELGIDRIVPFRAARSVVRWDDAKAAKSVARLRQVARAAAVQCRRPRLPEISEVTEASTLVAAAGPGVALAARDGVPLGPDTTTILVGPEGGWADDELALDVPRVTLGTHVLRAETAAIAAGVLLAAHRDVTG